MVKVLDLWGGSIPNSEGMRFLTLKDTLTICVTRPIAESTITAVPVFRRGDVSIASAVFSSTSSKTHAWTGRSSESVSREEVIKSLLSGDNDLHQPIIKAFDDHSRVWVTSGDSYSDTSGGCDFNIEQP